MDKRIEELKSTVRADAARIEKNFFIVLKFIKKKLSNILCYIFCF